MDLFNLIGITGIALIILAYLLLQVGRMKTSDILYPLLNLVGAFLHIVSLYRYWNLASFIIEIFWMAISVYGIYIIKNKSNHDINHG